MDRFHLISVFVAVVDANGFAGAARKLGISPPAVTRAISALEQQLAVRLLTTNEAIALVQGNKNPPPAVAAGKLPPKPRPWWERVLAVVALGVPLGVVWWRFYRRGAGASAPPAK